MMNQDDPAIRTENLSCRFGKLEAVHSLNLEVPSNSIYAFLGPNGAGKSTTLSILVRGLRATSGKAFVLGKDSQKLQAQDFTQIGYVAESQEMPDWMTGTQTIHFLKPFYPNWDESFQHKLEETLNLPLERQVRHMSRGERMKLRLLCSMAYRPKLLIMDEPFSGLDASIREDLSSGLLELVGEGDWTVVLASHDLDELERLVDHAGFISQGELRFSESVEALQARHQKVTARFEAQPTISVKPPSWSSFEQAGPEIRFIDSAFDEVKSRAHLSELGMVRYFGARPLSLREIFVSTTRGQHSTGKVAA